MTDNDVMPFSHSMLDTLTKNTQEMSKSLTESTKSACPISGSDNSSTYVNSSSECPVKALNSDSEQSKAWSFSNIISYWKGSQSTSNTPKELGTYNPQTNDYIFDSNSKILDQKKFLQTVRVVSSIPKGEFVPSHQPENMDKWVYPSEQQYFNAMKKKGYNPQEEDVPVVLAIHNMVNEEAWARIREWESLHKRFFSLTKKFHINPSVLSHKSDTPPKLARFTGRPNDLSPKAYLRSWFGYSLPFDRHDWYISRNGSEVRYVIDFYKGSQAEVGYSRTGKPTAPIAMYMDVRPALDSPAALVDRVYMSMREYFMGKPLPSPPSGSLSVGTGTAAGVDSSLVKKSTSAGSAGSG